MTPEAIDAMVNAGATPEVLAALWKAQLVEQAESTEKRREKDRERQRRHRESRDVTVTDCDTPSLEVSPQTPLPNPNPCSAPLNPPKKGKKALVVQVPDWVPAEPWVAFVAHRKAMRGITFTPDAAKLLIGKLDQLRGEGHCPAKLLNKAVMHGWRTVFPADDTKAAGTGTTRTAEWYDEQAKFFAGLNNSDEAQRMKAKAAKLRSGAGPPKAIGSVTAEILRRAG